MERLCRLLARSTIRLAALRAPAATRPAMVREWDAEIEFELRSSSVWGCVLAAMGAFADAGAIREIHGRGRRGEGTMATGVAILRDEMRHAVRALARARGFTAVAIVMLGVGIGAAASIATLLHRVILEPLPYPEPERLVRLENQVPGVGPDLVWQLSTAQFLHYSERASTLDEVGLYRTQGGNVATATGVLRARAVSVTASTVRTLGLRAESGRVIDAEDDRPGAPAVALLSYEFWSTSMGSTPDVEGTSVIFNDRPYEVIGVLAPRTSLPGVAFEVAPDLWLPMRVDPEGYFGNNHVFPAVGRLAAGKLPRDVEMELDALERSLPDAFPTAYRPSFLEGSGFRTTATPLKEHVLGDLASRVWLLFGGVALVLVIACANVANLFIARMESKRSELAVRRALGAGRVGLARYVLAEALTLSMAGGVLSLLIVSWAIPALSRLAPLELPRVQGLRATLGTAGVTVALSMLVALLVAAWPLVRTSEGWTQGLAGRARGGTAGRSRHRGRAALVVTQIAFAVSLLVGAGLLVDGLRVLRQTDPGFNPIDSWAIDLHASQLRYPDDAALWGFHRAVLERVSGIPGVVSAGMGEVIPVSGGYGCTVQAFEDEGVYTHINTSGLNTCAGQQRVTPGYFAALGIPLLEGRLLEEGDFDDPSRGAVVVSRAFAERFWPGRSPIGEGVGPNGRNEPPFFRVVGVVGDVKKRASDGRPPLGEAAVAIYYPGVHIPESEGNWGFWWPGSTTLVVSTDGTAGDVTAAVRRAVLEVDPETPVANARSMEDVVAGAMASLSFLSTLMAIAAVVALVLATVGLYGIVSYVVTQRRREIGMRLAIGARPDTVVREIVSRTARLVLLGIAIGVPLAVLTVRLGRSALVGIEPTAPLAYLGASLTVAVVALLAGWAPARRAAAIDPVESLRYDEA